MKMGKTKLGFHSKVRARVKVKGQNWGKGWVSSGMES
jgi:hypothetical protein